MPTITFSISTSKILEFKYKGSKRQDYSLHYAAAIGDAKLTFDALKNGQQVDTILDGITPLHAAARAGNTTVVHMLVGARANLNAERLPYKSENLHKDDASSGDVALKFRRVWRSGYTGTLGCTPLHFAAANGHFGVMGFLLKQGADFSKADTRGITPLMLAESMGQKNSATILRNWAINHASVNIPTPSTSTIKIAPKKLSIKRSLESFISRSWRGSLVNPKRTRSSSTMRHVGDHSQSLVSLSSGSMGIGQDAEDTEEEIPGSLNPLEALAQPPDTSEAQFELAENLNAVPEVLSVAAEPIVGSIAKGLEIGDRESPGFDALSNGTPAGLTCQPRASLQTTSDQSSRHSAISRLMTATEVVRHLSRHGCEDLTEQMDQSSFSEYPLSSGGFGDVYRGCFHNGTKIAIKTVRDPVPFSEDSKKSLKNAARELYIWSKCEHSNVLPLLGLAVFRNHLGMVSGWMENGNLISYIKRNPNSNRWEMSTQICDGVAYLHHEDVGIVHGDLKGANIVISAEGIPMLTDFGNAVLQDYTLRFTHTTHKNGLSAPELIDEGDTTHSIAADVYALGMTILETFTGRVPFYGKADRAVYAAVMKHKIPERPHEIPSDNDQANGLWSVLESCWDPKPANRPTASEVANLIKEISTRGKLQHGA
ncbi:Serine/threonine-protein kinase [Ceratobasidium sp. AG-Ba]|nr:Serine/threonine-protein kinase [Ceratobasidium sp. AG-Ba]